MSRPINSARKTIAMPTTLTPPQAPEPILQPPGSDELLAVLADAIRDDSDHYDDPPLAAS